jgi:hypothetical protein
MQKKIISRRFIPLLAFGAVLVMLIFTGTQQIIISAENANCSFQDKTETNIIFSNKSNHPVKLYNLNEKCQEVVQKNLEPGMKYSQKTYVSQAWRVREPEKKWLLREVTPSSGILTTVQFLNLTTNLNRVTENRPDDISGYQIHVMYVLPKDKEDEALDTNGKIATSVAAWQQWFIGQTDGQRLRVDTYDGALDITFVRLQQTDAEIKNSRKVRNHIETQLKELGFNDPQKLYAVYYAGSNSLACGAQAFPPNQIGNVAAVFLDATGRDGSPCDTKRFATNVNQPGYIEMEIVHRIIHGLGFAPKCAPHYTEHILPGHVSDNPQDLLYDGVEPSQASLLDIGHDDYFKHNNPGCIDLANSLFLDPAKPDAVAPPGWKSR